MTSPTSKIPTTPIRRNSPTASSSLCCKILPSKIPVRVNSKKVAVSALKAALETAVRAKETRYSNILAIAVRWDDDDTSAKADNETFTAMMRDMFDIPCKTLVLQSQSQFPAWDLNVQLVDEIKAKLKNQKPSLLIFSYAGYGAINALDELSFSNRGGKKLVSWTAVQHHLTPHGLPMDIFAILDCCHSGKATISSQNSTHTLAACGLTVWARSRTSGISFTQRLVRAIRPIFNSDKVAISTDEIFHAVQRETPTGLDMPRFSCHSGVKPIVLPFKVAATSGSGIPSSAASSPSHKTSPITSLTPRISPLASQNRESQVLIMLILEGRATGVVRDFQRVLETMPAKFQMKITDAFETNASASVFVRMTWEAFARFLSTIDMEPLLPVVGPSLMRGQLHEVPIVPARESPSLRERAQRK
ncbi:uncharacterized protein N7500_009093 [Penicillium coprophilum]|uniref:uncharacterized protein n=1 Tax=Penicillium coprophilum TaxID=36646 RepID=UPI00238C0A6C|nr:uncharacterized protein N7500_009093 [Penicillium coprophilum]KAJ5153654.1 hypothetical protein N7500_009093 [Penicillium coprophilum]